MVWIPVILTLVLGPGMGQLYNKDYKKAIYLIVLSLFVASAAVTSMKNIFMPNLPADITTEDPAELMRVIQANAAKTTSDHAGILFCYALLLAGIWGYSVVDAYKGGRRRLLESKLKIEENARRS
jgi:Mn2+/Fe2+ NRAMP family transporter